MSIFKKQQSEAATDTAPPSSTPVSDEAGGPGERTSLLSLAAGYSWRLLLVLAMGWLFIQLLIKLRLVVLPIIAALFVTALLGPLAQRLKKKGWHPLLATWTVLLGTILVFVALVSVLAPAVADELDDVGASVRQGSEEVLDYLASSPLKLSKADIERYIDSATEQISRNQEKITSGVLVGAAKAVEFITQFFLMLVLLFFFIKDGPKMFAWFESQFPPRNRRHVREIGERAWAAIGGYLRGTAIIALVDAVLIAIALLIVGVPLVIPLAVLTFMGAFFPLIGAVAAGMVAALVALVTQGPGDALIIAGAILVIQQVEGDVLQPLVMGRAVSLHPVVILLALTAGAIVAGVIGAFLAVPVTAVAAATGNYIKKVTSESTDNHVAPAAAATAD